MFLNIISMLIMRLVFPILDHLVGHFKKDKETLALNEDHIYKRGENVHSTISIVVLMITFPARILDCSITDQHGSNHKAAG